MKNEEAFETFYALRDNTRKCIHKLRKYISNHNIGDQETHIWELDNDGDLVLKHWPDVNKHPKMKAKRSAA